VSKRARTIVVLPDRHFGLHDEDPIPWRATEVAMRAIEYLSADETVVLGDWLDGASCSSHAASSMREMLHQGYMETEVRPCQEALDRIQATSKRLVYLEGNHEQRVLRWALSQISRGPIGDVVQSLAPRELLARTASGKARKNFTWVSYIGPLPRYNIAPNLIAIHGWSCAANAAKAHLDKARSSSVVHGHCLPRDYEVCTTAGWVALSAITTEHVALTYTPAGMEWAPVEEVVSYSYTGEMAEFSHQRLTMEMTDRHHVFTHDGRYIPIRDAIDAGLRTGALPYRGEPVGGPGIDWSDDQIRLAVAYCADGSFEARTNSIRWHLKKQRKIDRLSAILDRLGAPIAWSELSKTGSRKSKRLARHIHDWLRAECPDKILPITLRELSAHQREVFLRELPYWDGSHIWADSVQFSSFNPLEIALVQEIAAQHGLLTWRGASGTVCGWNWNACAHGDYSDKLGDIVAWRSVQNLDVGCITTRNQNFVVRHPKTGQVQVSGNTHRRQEHVSRDPMTGAMFYGWSPGALCTMLPDYRSNNPTDWCYGFTVIYQSRARPEDWTHYNVTISPDGRRAVLPDGHTITV
jgi:hypothetical protein